MWRVAGGCCLSLSAECLSNTNLINMFKNIKVENSAHRTRDTAHGTTHNPEPKATAE